MATAEVYSTTDTAFFVDCLFGPRQHDEHMKGWRWHLFVRDVDKRDAAVDAVIREMRAERRLREDEAAYERGQASYKEALQDPAKACALFDASKGGNVRGITEDHRFQLANVFSATRAPTLIPQKVSARHMQPGDVIGSGETVVSVSAGVRTPRGKVEVVLERNGNRRLAVWGAYTAINVRRAA